MKNNFKLRTFLVVSGDIQIIVKLIVKIFENTDERHKVEMIKIKKRKLWKKLNLYQFLAKKKN